jgi:hypothetical protein
VALLSSAAGVAGSTFGTAGLTCAGVVAVGFGGSVSGPRVPQAVMRKDALTSSMMWTGNPADEVMRAMLTRRQIEEKWKKKNS